MLRITHPCSIVTAALCCFLGIAALAQPRFVHPVEGVVGEDYSIVNYVDWGVGASVQDHACGSKAYDGHQGTDYVLKSFAAMDSGVNVLAVDTGVVIFTLDGIFDREKESVISKGLGNYIGLTHSGNYQTYYGHLKKNSILVSVGDTVYPGQVIAQVASSGNSTDPHLHFELWYDSTFYIDPFMGDCGNPGTFWFNPQPYDTAFHVWTNRMWNGIPFLDTLREAPVHVDTFVPQNSAITAWSLLRGLRAGDSLTGRWIKPDQSVYTEFSIGLTQDWWYYYYWSYILPPDTAFAGSWRFELLRNGTEVLDSPFEYVVPDSDTSVVAVEDIQNHSEIRVNHHALGATVFLDKPQKVRIMDIRGTVMSEGRFSGQMELPNDRFPPGVYLLHFQGSNEVHKVLLGE